MPSEGAGDSNKTAGGARATPRIARLLQRSLDIRMGTLLHEVLLRCPTLEITRGRVNSERVRSIHNPYIAGQLQHPFTLRPRWSVPRALRILGGLHGPMPAATPTSVRVARRPVSRLSKQP